MEVVRSDLFWTQSKHNVLFSLFSLVTFCVCLFFHSTLKTMWLALLAYHFTTILLAHGQNACTGHSTFRAPGQRHPSVPTYLLSFCFPHVAFILLFVKENCMLKTLFKKTHGCCLIIKSYLLTLVNKNVKEKEMNNVMLISDSFFPLSSSFVRHPGPLWLSDSGSPDPPVSNLL